MAGIQSQREKLREQRKATQRKKTITWGSIVAIVAVAIVIITFLPKWTANKELLTNQSGFSIGDPNAPVKVEEFSDFRCSHCRDFSEDLEPDFIKNYVDTNKVYFTFYNYPFLADDSTDAAEAAYCAADQNAFWQYKSLLFSNSSDQNAYSETNLISYAKLLGLDIDKFTSCLQTDQHLEAIAADKEYAKSLGVDSTPQFSVNGTLVFSSELDQTVEAELAK
ncbi:MAG: thioredoxin domain-containing protein [Anaerolineaceae bacterium]